MLTLNLSLKRACTGDFCDIATTLETTEEDEGQM